MKVRELKAILEDLGDCDELSVYIVTKPNQGVATEILDVRSVLPAPDNPWLLIRARSSM